MPRYPAAILALPALIASAAHADDQGLCRAVAYRLWSEVATMPLREQTPLAELTAVAPAAVQPGRTDLAKPNQSIADALIQDHAADATLVHKLNDLPPREAVRFGETNAWLLDRVDGTLGCHTAIMVVVPPTGPAHETDLPGHPDPTTMCALSALTAVTIDGTPALWIEQSGAFSNALEQSTITIAAVRDDGPAPPCTVAVDYTVSDHATHAFCDGIDCVPLIRLAEVLAMRLRQKETAESLGVGALRNTDDEATYRRMTEIAASGSDAPELPTFGVSLETPYTVFADALTFPLRLDDGRLYLGRMGHGAFGWRQTADTLLALYRLHDDRLVPAASAYVAAQRTGIIGVSVQ